MALGRDRTPFSSGIAMGENSVFLGQKGWEKTKSAPDPVLRGRVRRRQEALRQGRLPRGREAPDHPLAKREIKKGSPWGEKAQFWLAETQFRLQKYVKANDSYEILIKKYPGTDYVDKLVAREYQIAQTLARLSRTPRPSRWTGPRTSTADSP